DRGQSAASSRVLDIVGDIPCVGREGAGPRRRRIVRLGPVIVGLSRAGVKPGDRRHGNAGGDSKGRASGDLAVDEQVGAVLAEGIPAAMGSVHEGYTRASSRWPERLRSGGSDQGAALIADVHLVGARRGGAFVIKVADQNRGRRRERVDLLWWWSCHPGAPDVVGRFRGQIERRDPRYEDGEGSALDHLATDEQVDVVDSGRIHGSTLRF